MRNFWEEMRVGLRQSGVGSREKELLCRAHFLLAEKFGGSSFTPPECCHMSDK